MHQSAEENGFQQLASAPRPKQDAANCGLGNGANMASSVPRPRVFYFRLLSSEPKQPWDKPTGFSGE
jgi:hypothetical protein